MRLLLFDSANIEKRTCTAARMVDAPPDKKTHTRSSVRLIEEEPCSPFVHGTSPSRMAFFLSPALYLSFLSPPSALSTILMVFVLVKKWQCPPLFEEITGAAAIHTWMFVCKQDVSPCGWDGAGGLGVESFVEKLWMHEILLVFIRNVRMIHISIQPGSSICLVSFGLWAAPLTMKMTFVISVSVGVILHLSLKPFWISVTKTLCHNLHFPPVVSSLNRQENTWRGTRLTPGGGKADMCKPIAVLPAFFLFLKAHLALTLLIQLCHGDNRNTKSRSELGWARVNHSAHLPSSSPLHPHLPLHLSPCRILPQPLNWN